MAKVLIVDDDEVTRLPIAASLERQGHVVIHASDGRSAIALVSAQSPDAIVLDLKLPDMDGFEVMEKLKDQDCSAPIVVLSRRESEADVEMAISLGAVEYIKKPQSPAHVRKAVQTALGEN